MSVRASHHREVSPEEHRATKNSSLIAHLVRRDNVRHTRSLRHLKWSHQSYAGGLLSQTWLPMRITILLFPLLNNSSVLQCAVHQLGLAAG